MHSSETVDSSVRSSDVAREGQAKLPHEMTLAEFAAKATVEELTNHRRKWQVSYPGNHSFSDAATAKEAIAGFHYVAVNNALYCNIPGARQANLPTSSLPPANVLAEYPNLVQRFRDAIPADIRDALPVARHPVPEVTAEVLAALQKEHASTADGHSMLNSWLAMKAEAARHGFGAHIALPFDASNYEISYYDRQGYRTNIYTDVFPGGRVATIRDGLRYGGPHDDEKASEDLELLTRALALAIQDYALKYGQPALAAEEAQRQERGHGEAISSLSRSQVSDQPRFGRDPVVERLQVVHGGDHLAYGDTRDRPVWQPPDAQSVVNEVRSREHATVNHAEAAISGSRVMHPLESQALTQAASRPQPSAPQPAKLTESTPYAAGKSMTAAIPSARVTPAPTVQPQQAQTAPSGPRRGR
ncbi:hypothetical protein [Xenophilus azovorans]|uniref:hypothetical protein n=1 Tax=Xenophilus azovorans TaxID=151755 RepID=UPI001B7FF97A|nr:hypothetical protein [Xenophilus azovorans]